MWQAHAGIVRLAAELADALAGQRASEAQLASATTRLGALEAVAEQLDSALEAAAACAAEATRKAAGKELALEGDHKVEQEVEQELLAVEEAVGQLSSQLEQVVCTREDKSLFTRSSTSGG